MINEFSKQLVLIVDILCSCLLIMIHRTCRPVLSVVPLVPEVYTFPIQTAGQPTEAGKTSGQHSEVNKMSEVLVMSGLWFEPSKTSLSC